MWDYIVKILIIAIPSVTTIITSIIAERKNKSHSAWTTNNVVIKSN